MPGVRAPPVLAFPLLGELPGLLGNGLAAGGERAHQLLADPGDLPAVAVPALYPHHAQIAGKCRLGDRRSDRRGGALDEASAGLPVPIAATASEEIR